MSDEYQQRPRGQDKQQPGEQEEMERRRREREEVQKRLRGGTRVRGAAAGSEYESMSSDASEEYGRRIAAVAAEAKDYVSDRVSAVGDKFRELQNADLGELAENVREYARQKPGQALLISACVGLLLGLIIRDRR